jgi:SecD/SecF fusion protein
LLDSLSALLTDVKDSASPKGNNPLFDKIIAQGGGPVLGLFSLQGYRDVNGYLKRADIKILLPAEQRLPKFVGVKATTITDAKDKLKLR